ncbi:tRNA-specific 2-thiouridylase [Allopseudospirillum japonicum]|uniref:tRNA-specific 2-thiouridylase MnmA n=1 Tax=Allopseudospirillum japonicum TaxID=64971 RepID=A0A1H6T7Q4_9GAMM|nr:tRNA 2-thiouridine(34) synthase MnmA [Allopseudospirillum japonicum]SEI71832.1 tRNA-specific 2-thiouridylase [Allopseudospirillum japonicum]
MQDTALTPPPAQTSVIVGMSGGVDSSVTAYLLQQQGYQVSGLFMKNWEEDDGTEYCTAKADLADAQAVCDKLGIHLHTANFAAEYWDNVFEYFLAEYAAGRTPNPDILCNREIKFKVFMQYAQILGADFIATGHYARRGWDGERAALYKGKDTQKDQSYFLHAVTSEALAKSLFPLGELTKPEVRKIATELGLVTARKKDSTGICFIGERRFRDFLKRYLPAQTGEIQTPEGDVIGQHQGLMYYTLGQRQGLGIGGLAKYPEAPWFVAGKDLERNVLIAVQGEHPLLYSQALVTEAFHWISRKPATDTFTCTAKVRYRQQEQVCHVEPLDEGRYRIQFAQAQRAVTPGQFVVLYQDDLCLGGAVIEHTFN